MPNDFTIIEVNNNLECFLIKCNAYEERKTSVHELFRRLFTLDKRKFQNKRVIISSGDYPESDEIYKGYDYKFSTTIPSRGDFFYNIFPCPHSIAWLNFNMSDVQGMLKEMLLNDRDIESNKIFWAGSPQHSQRRVYVDFSQNNNDICDSFMINNEDPALFKETKQKYFLTLPEHAKYKYLIDLQGQGYSGRLKYLLATHRPVFIPDRPWVEHWHRKLVPWKHFVPVKDDFSDLRENYEILEKDTALYNDIRDNAKIFVQEHILLEKQLPYILDTL